MQARFIRFFIFSAAVLLFATSIAKLISVFGKSHILETHDPLFEVSYRNLLLIAGAFEFATSLVCFLVKSNIMRVGLVAWLATVFLMYRIGMPFVGYQQPCPCLGSLTGEIHISSQTANTVAKVILSYLLVGSYVALLGIWRRHKVKSIPVLA
ncbi:MAG TPA: hypothetical protein VJT54_16430 [Verrucomicrobiae bacterium]|nr:hypothetical protein [Verrucomicrobiae bacterium]